MPSNEPDLLRLSDGVEPAADEDVEGVEEGAGAAVHRPGVVPDGAGRRLLEDFGGKERVALVGRAAHNDDVGVGRNGGREAGEKGQSYEHFQIEIDCATA